MSIDINIHHKVVAGAKAEYYCRIIRNYVGGMFPRLRSRLNVTSGHRSDATRNKDIYVCFEDYKDSSNSTPQEQQSIRNWVETQALSYAQTSWNEYGIRKVSDDSSD